MNLLKEIEIENFKCFRERITVPLGQGTYLVGMNNSGKTTILAAIRVFFDESLFSEQLLNQTKYTSRRSDGNTTYNEAVISITIKLNALDRGKERKRRLLRTYGNWVKITSHLKYLEASKKTTRTYSLAGEKGTPRSPESGIGDEDLEYILTRVHISYIHPQEGDELLSNAQKKLKERLLFNWGRSSHGMTLTLQKLAQTWEKMREESNRYLSGSLTESLQTLWPESKTIATLPKKIEDILSVSDITFQQKEGEPQISLTSQGTGAQSMILYHTHFILDSDRTLHMGEYFPIWLLEEPESFLHSDLISQLSHKLNSTEWLGKIQMIISTHSPIILSGSTGKPEVQWIITDDHQIKDAYVTVDATDERVKKIGKIMRDHNFDIYFNTNNQENIFIEDTRALTISKFRESGIDVTKALKGETEIRKYIEVLIGLPPLKKQTFIIDGDLPASNYGIPIQITPRTVNGFKQYKIDNNVSAVRLPEGMAVEHLFEQYKSHIEDCFNELYENNPQSGGYKLKDPTRRLTGIYTSLKYDYAHIDINKKNEILGLLKNKKEVKDIFWGNVESGNYRLDSDYVRTIKGLID